MCGYALSYSSEVEKERGTEFGRTQDQIIVAPNDAFNYTFLTSELIMWMLDRE